MSHRIVYTLGTTVTLASAGLLFSCISPEDRSEPEPDESQLRASVEPILVDGNPDCGDLPTLFPEEFGGKTLFECRIEPINPEDPDNTYQCVTEFGTITVTTDDDKKIFDWASAFGIDVVMSKGGNAANVYIYDEATSDTNLLSPEGPGGTPALSHISFCYDVNIEVTKTAETTFTRTRDWDWTINKEALGPATLVLQPGAFYLYPYRVTVTPSLVSDTESDWAVSGTITIENPTSVPVAINEPEDVISGVGPVDVDCGNIVFPYTLPAHGSLECTYASDLPDGSDRMNTATVTTVPGSGVEGDSGTAPITFGAPTTVEDIDECVNIEDDKAGSLGSFCVDPSDPMPHSIDYNFSIQAPLVCGESVFENTASFETTEENPEMGEDTETVTIEVPCEGEGCTLTRGYWGTHADCGPANAPRDDTWDTLPEAEDTDFFNTGVSWCEVFWFKPKTDEACVRLAAQWIAAYFNSLNGASLEPIQETFDEAQTLLEDLGLNFSGCDKSEAKALAEILDQYNNGLIEGGPEHCSESSE